MNEQQMKDLCEAIENAGEYAAEGGFNAVERQEALKLLEKATLALAELAEAVYAVASAIEGRK